MSNLDNIKKEFFILTRTYLKERITNKLIDNSLRKDYSFYLLAERIYDNPKILRVLKKKIGSWLSQDNSEITLALAAYIYYLDCDFNKAKKYFLKAVEKNPKNLDNWFDLAFCLYHCSPELNNLSKAILFNYDLFIKDFNKNNYKKCSIDRLEEIRKKIIRRKLNYAYTYKKFTDKQVLKLYLTPPNNKKRAI